MPVRMQQSSLHPEHTNQTSFVKLVGTSNTACGQGKARVDAGVWRGLLAGSADTAFQTPLHAGQDSYDAHAIHAKPSL